MRGDKTIGARLRSARLQTGWSQEKLGVFAGLDEVTVSARMSGYENGKHTPAPLILQRLADVLRIPAPYFYAKDDRLAELIRSYGQLSAEEQEKIIETARRLVKAENTKKVIPPSKKVPVRRKVPVTRRPR